MSGREKQNLHVTYVSSMYVHTVNNSGTLVLITKEFECFSENTHFNGKETCSYSFPIMAYSQQKRKTENVLRYAFLNLQEETS